MSEQATALDQPTKVDLGQLVVLTESGSADLNSEKATHYAVLGTGRSTGHATKGWGSTCRSFSLVDGRASMPELTG